MLDTGCRFVPAHVFQHHHAAEQQGGWIHGIGIRETRRRSVRGFKHCMAGIVVDIGARSNTYPPNRRRRRI